MYTLVQNQNFLDDIQLQKADGSTETLHISLVITPDIIKRYRQLQVKLMALEKERKSGLNEETVVKVGAAVVDVFNLLFGENNTQKLLEFYKNDFTQMVTELFPYIQGEIVPRFQQAAKARKQAFKKRRF